MIYLHNKPYLNCELNFKFKLKKYVNLLKEKRKTEFNQY